jgi:hypothetical protein
VRGEGSGLIGANFHSLHLLHAPWLTWRGNLRLSIDGVQNDDKAVIALRFSDLLLTQRANKKYFRFRRVTFSPVRPFKSIYGLCGCLALSRIEIPVGGTDAPDAVAGGDHFYPSSRSLFRCSRVHIVVKS